jgi:hypothetical protein
MAKDYTRQMIKTIRENVEKTKSSKVNPLIIEETITEEDNFLTRAKILMEEAENEKKKLNEEDNKNTFNDDKHGKAFRITKSTPQFGDVRTSQEEALLKTIGEQVTLEDDALLFYPNKKELVLNGKVPSLNLTFQFRYNDPSGVGVYIYADGLQLSDENSRTIGKIHDAFVNWKQNLVNDGNLIKELCKVAGKED